MNETPPKWREQARMLARRIEKNAKRLSSWRRQENVTCYRLYDRDIPEIPLAVDWYQGRLHVSVYERKERALDHEKLRAWLDPAARELGVDDDRIFIKWRRRQEKGSQYEKIGSRKQSFQVREGDALFWVNLSDYLDTGLFLDHRRTRTLVGKEAKGTHFLNLFCYTGSFTVYAARAGAASTTSVDLSNTYLSWAQENLRLNGFEDEERHRLVRDDAFGFLAHHTPPRGGYDLVVIDPPTVSRSKKMTRKLDIQRDHVELIQETARHCRRGAVIYFSTNYRKFELAEPSLSNLDILDITAETTPFDFRDDKIHRCFRMMKR